MQRKEARARAWPAVPSDLCPATPAGAENRRDHQAAPGTFLHHSWTPNRPQSQIRRGETKLKSKEVATTHVNLLATAFILS